MIPWNRSKTKKKTMKALCLICKYFQYANSKTLCAFCVFYRIELHFIWLSAWIRLHIENWNLHTMVFFSLYLRNTNTVFDAKNRYFKFAAWRWEQLPIPFTWIVYWFFFQEKSIWILFSAMYFMARMFYTLILNKWICVNTHLWRICFRISKSKICKSYRCTKYLITLPSASIAITIITEREKEEKTNKQQSYAKYLHKRCFFT